MHTKWWKVTRPSLNKWKFISLMNNLFLFVSLWNFIPVIYHGTTSASAEKLPAFQMGSLHHDINLTNIW